MDLLLGIVSKDRKWYHIIGWWEIRRIPYNIIMVFAGQLSFKIAYISIPLIYLFIGVVLNIFYTFGWVLEVMLTQKNNSKLQRNLSRPFYIGYLLFSLVLIVGFAVSIVTATSSNR
jgi:hypothetical protein